MKAVVTVTGKDKVGIIAMASAECAKYGANIIDISQTVLSEYFAMIMMVSLEGLTVDFAQEQEASCIVRGIRSVKDFEYEETIADVNRRLSGIDTIFLFTEPELSSVSSSIVRELLHYGKDVSTFLPPNMEI